MSHQFGDLLTQHLHRRHGLSQSKLAWGIDQDPAVISAMCKGLRLHGLGARERVVRVIAWLHEQGVMSSVAEADALLAAADLAGLSATEATEAALLQALAKDSDSAPSPTYHAPAPSANLPIPLTSFVGREEACSTVRQLLGQAPLVTLLGPGGIGKTRLALEVAATLADAYADGVYLVELGPLREGDLVPQTVAGALGLGVASGRPLLDTIVAHLRPRQTLLVLDNCEHLVDASAALVTRLLRACPRLTILVTCREILRVAGEVPWLVPPLALPSSDSASLSQFDPARKESTPAAVQLFADRAQRAHAAWKLTAANMPAVIQICRRLDGLPLALELAAACTRAMTVEQIAARLHRRFNLLQGGARDGLPHHQTLQATIAWSDDLLTPHERTLFARLGVFAGSWSLEAAEAVCAGTPVYVEDVWTLLAALVDKSLVVAEEQAGSTCYRMLETIREYARTLPCKEAVLDRMVDYYLRYIQDHAADYAALDGEIPNILAALKLAAARDQAALVRGVNALYHFLETRGWYDLADDLLTQAAAVARSGDDPCALITVLLHQGRLAERNGAYSQAESLYQEGLSMARSNNDTELVSALLQNLGGLAMRRGDYVQAEACLREGLALARENGDRERTSALLGNLGSMEVYYGSSAKADLYYQESLALAREIGNQERICALLQGLGVTAGNRGDYAQADVYLREGLSLARAIGHQERISHLLVWLAEGALSRGDDASANAYLHEGLAVARAIKNRERTSHLLVNLGTVALYRGDSEEAETYLQESLALAREIDHQERSSHALLKLGELARRCGDNERADLLLQESMALARSLRYQRLICAILIERGELELALEKPATAALAWREALDFAQTIGSAELEGRARYGLARATAAQGEWSEARHMGEVSRDIFAAIGHTSAPVVASWLAGLPQRVYA